MVKHSNLKKNYAMYEKNFHFTEWVIEVQSLRNHSLHLFYMAEPESKSALLNPKNQAVLIQYKVEF